MNVAPTTYFPRGRTNNVVSNILGIRDQQYSRHVRPRLITANPLEGLDTGQQFHPIYVALGASEVNDLFVGPIEAFGEMNYEIGRASCRYRVQFMVMAGR